MLIFFRRIASSICSTIANGTPLDKIRAEIKEQIDYHDNEHRKYDSEEEFGISLGLELALAMINKEVEPQESEVKGYNE
jgi:hypothetical protein